MTAWDGFVATQGGIRAEQLFPGLWRLIEPAMAPACRSCFYLLETPDALVLIDGGWGLLRGLGELPVSDGRPLVAIATHSHCDHLGALHLAPTRYGHAAEAAVFADPEPFATQARPWIDDLVLAADGSRIDPASFRQTACPLTHLLAEGDVLDLGAGPLRVLATPGHSPGSLCLLAPGPDWLFCGDTLHDGHIYDDIPGADPAALNHSHDRLLGLDFRWAMPGHGVILSREAAVRRVARYRCEKERRRAGTNAASGP